MWGLNITEVAAVCNLTSGRTLTWSDMIQYNVVVHIVRTDLEWFMGYRFITSETCSYG